jgi:hypothetical protein
MWYGDKSSHTSDAGRATYLPPSKKVRDRPEASLFFAGKITIGF